jgi:hypothetical protein
MSIFISCMDFTVCTQAGSNRTDMFAMAHCSAKDTGTFIQPAYVGHDTHNVQNGKKVLDAVYANALTSTSCVAHETGLSQSPV